MCTFMQWSIIQVFKETDTVRLVGKWIELIKKRRGKEEEEEEEEEDVKKEEEERSERTKMACVHFHIDIRC